MNKQEFLKKLEIELKISKNSEYTIRNYVMAVNNFLDFSKKQPEEVTQEDIKLYMAENLTEKAASSTILFLAAIKYSFTSILQKDPTTSIKRPKKEKKIPTVLTKQEIKTLLLAVTNKKSNLMLSLTYACGFRVSELVNLKIKDLHFEEKIGYVRQTKGKKDRMFNIPDFLINKLQKQVKLQKSLGKEYLFTGPKGKLSSRNIQKIVQKAAKKAEIQKSVHPHTLRHS